MNEPDDPERVDGQTPATRAWVDRRLDRFGAQLASEIRTERIVVLNEGGEPLVVISARADLASVELRSSPHDRASVGVELTAHRGTADQAAALSLTRNGNVVAALTVTESAEGGICRLAFVFDEPTTVAERLIIDADGIRREPAEPTG